MSVKVADRNESKCEAVWNATVLKAEIHDLCIRDFGVKDVNQLVRLKYAYGVEDEENFEKYVLLMHQCKKRVHFLSDEIIADTRAANRIKMNCVRRCNNRLDLQDRAIGDCEMLIGKLQDVVDVFWVDINKMERYIKAIDHEIDLIRNWEGYTNAQLHKLLKPKSRQKK